MIIYKVITIACLIISLIIFLSYIILFFKKNRKERIEFLKRFKKGDCVLIYLVAIPLNVIGYYYTKEDILYSIFMGINKTVNLVVLKYDLSNVIDLMNALFIFKVTVYIVFVLVAINAILLTVSIFQQRIWILIQNLKWRISSKEKLIIFGVNDGNIQIYQSEKKRQKIIIDDISKKEKERLYIENIFYKSREAGLKYIERFITNFADGKNKHYVIINSLDETTNINICSQMYFYIDEKCKLFDKNQEVDESLKLFNSINIFVFGSEQQESIYREIVEKSKGCIQLVDKYKLIAMDYVERHPLTEYLDSKHIDYATYLLKPNVDINVLFIGFGKTNRQVFFTTIANNQFGTKNPKEGIDFKQVNYYIFDKEKSSNDKNLNHEYYRYRNEFYIKDESTGKYIPKVDADKYLPLPDLPANEEYFQMDINDSAFYERIFTIVSANVESLRKANYIIIAFGTDLENIDMAQKLSDKKKEWGIENLNIFVKIRKKERVNCFLSYADFISFANEKDVVYNIERIVNNNYVNVAKERNRLYALEQAYVERYKDHKSLVLNHMEIEQIKKMADYKWYTKRSQNERDSNIYCCLSLRFKLNLMGLDFCPINTSMIKKSEKQYLLDYEQNDTIEYYPIEDSNSDNSKRIVHYDLININHRSNRQTMAVLEHFRWNSYMLSKGIVPATKEDILKDTKYGKDYALRKHNNLTTFSGLIEFRKMIAQKFNKEEKEIDVIKYDYQLMDDAYWLLDKMGQELIEKK